MSCVQNPILERQSRRGALDAANEHWREKHLGKLSDAYNQAVAEVERIRQERKHLPLSIRRIDPGLHYAEGRAAGIHTLQEARRRGIADGMIARWLIRLEQWAETGTGRTPEPWQSEQQTPATVEGGSGAPRRPIHQGVDPHVRFSY